MASVVIAKRTDVDVGVDDGKVINERVMQTRAAGPNRLKQTYACVGERAQKNHVQCLQPLTNLFQLAYDFL